MYILGGILLLILGIILGLLLSIMSFSVFAFKTIEKKVMNTPIKEYIQTKEKGMLINADEQDFKDNLKKLSKQINADDII